MIPERRSVRSTLSTAGAVVLIGGLVCALTVSAAGAGSTAVWLEPTDGQIAPGETTTVDVVVENADGGVGAYNVTLSVGTPEVAAIEAVETRGSPGMKTVDSSEDGSSVVVTAALMNTSNAGSVTIATVTLRGSAKGSTDVAIAPTELGDESGRGYDIGEIRNATLAVDAENHGAPYRDSGPTRASTRTSTPVGTPEGGTSAGTPTATAGAAPAGTTSADSSASAGTTASADGTAEAVRSPAADSSPVERSPTESGGLDYAVVLGALAVLAAGFLVTRRA
jgi:hypothetical protein